MHVYPATPGPHNPNLGHAVGMAGGQNAYNISSHNYDRLEEGMIFVLHTQWLEPMSAGCNIGDLYLVTADGFENLSRHTPLETHRVAASDASVQESRSWNSNPPTKPDSRRASAPQDADPLPLGGGGPRDHGRGHRGRRDRHADVSRGTADQPSPGAMRFPSAPGRSSPWSRSPTARASPAVKLLADIPDNASRRLADPAIGPDAGVAGDRRLRGDLPRPDPDPHPDRRGERRRDPPPARPDSRVLGLIGAGDLAVEHVARARAGAADRACRLLDAQSRHRRALRRTDRRCPPAARGDEPRHAARGRRRLPTSSAR